MKPKRSAVLSALAVLLIPFTAYANSSWHWLTETTPLTVLPFAIAGTLAIEISAIVVIGKVKSFGKAILVILLANLVSFLAAFFLGAIDRETLYSIMDVIMHTPHYIVSGFYLALTLAFELPVVYFLLHKDTENEKRFIASIILSNIVTTILVSVCEGIFAQGQW